VVGNQKRRGPNYGAGRPLDSIKNW
jgi:hypothetical protein